MNKNGVLSSSLIAELADGFQKRQTFNITHGAADFHDGNIKSFCRFADEIFDLVGDVRNDLDGFTQVIASSFFGDDGKVNLAGGEVVAFPHPGG